MSKAGTSTTTTATFATHLDRKVEELRRLVPQALKSWDPDAIHDARVATRRLKASIDLLEPLLPDKRRRDFAKTLKRLRQSLGPLRDVDVMLGHLQEIAKKPREFSGAISWLTAALEQKRTELRRKCARETPPQRVLKDLGEWWSLEQDLTESENAARGLLRRLAATQWKDFSTGAERLIASRTTAPVTHEGSGDLHALRIAGKRIRYTLELAEPAGYSLDSAVLKHFKKLQEALGMWHDYVVLGQKALKLALKHEIIIHDSLRFGEILQLASYSWRKSEHYVKEFENIWSKFGEEIGNAIGSSLKTSAPTPAPAPEPETIPTATDVEPPAPVTETT